MVAGEVVTGSLARKACERHLNDLETGHLRGLVWSVEAAMRPIKFAKEFCVHAEGEDFAGQPVELEPWEVFVVGSLFGWLKRNKKGRMVRRFRKALVAIARKNGKSTLGAVIALYLLIADKEPAAQVYSAATKMQQAMIVWKAAKRMVQASPELRAWIELRRNRMFIPTTDDSLDVKCADSEFLPIGRDRDRQDGFNPSAAVVDEIHAHPDSGVYDVLSSGMGARSQPLIVALTTAGFNAEGFGAKEWEYVVSILQGTVQDDAYFGVIYALDEGDDPFDEAVWIKANPNLEVSCSLDYLRTEANSAKQAPHKRNSFLCKNLNLWVSAIDAWMPLDIWDASAGPKKRPDELLQELSGRPCFMGYDLSSRRDMSAVVLVFLPTADDPVYRVVPLYWMPEEELEQRERDDKIPYRSWVDQGYMNLCPGPTIDQELIEETILDLAQQFNVIEVAYDPYNAWRTAKRLSQAGLTMVSVRQYWSTLSEPMKELGQLVYDKLFDHAGNPVMRWNIQNTRAKQDDNENIRPIKPKDRRKRIDGVAATITAMARVMAYLDQAEDDHEPIEVEVNGRRVKIL